MKLIKTTNANIAMNQMRFFHAGVRLFSDKRCFSFSAEQCGQKLYDLSYSLSQFVHLLVSLAAEQ